MPRSLLSVDALASQLDDPTIRIVDCRWYLGEPDRGRAAYESGHLPGAVYASLDADLSADEGPGRHPLPTPQAFSASMAALGIGEGTRVVTYDDRGGAVAARLWWMMTSQGRYASVLDGGIEAWVTAGHRVTTGRPVIPDVRPLGARRWEGTVTLADVARRSEDVVLLDARSTERYLGDEEPIDPKAGHIPGARSLPLTDNLDADDRFLDPASIRDRMAGAGWNGSTRSVAHCGSGVTACHLVLAAEIAGLPRPELYVGSWSEWSRSDMPFATGPDP